MCLTPRQQQVLQHLADGHTTVTAAHAMGVSVGVASNYATAARERLGAGTAAYAVAIALRRGLIQ